MEKHTCGDISENYVSASCVIHDTLKVKCPVGGCRSALRFIQYKWAWISYVFTYSGSSEIIYPMSGAKRLMLYHIWKQYTIYAKPNPTLNPTLNITNSVNKSSSEIILYQVLHWASLLEEKNK